MQNKIEKLCTLHQCHLSHYKPTTYMGVELVKSGEETLHPHYLLVFNRLKQVGVECRVFPVEAANLTRDNRNRHIS